LRVRVDQTEMSLEEAMGLLHSAERDTRRIAADAIGEALQPGLRTRAFVFNTLLLDKSTDDRLRGYPHWLAERNLSNEAPDETVEALVSAVVSRYDIPQRYYRLKARLLGLPRLAHYDRMAPVVDESAFTPWDEAEELVRSAYADFSPDAGAIVDRFFDDGWIDAPVRPDKMIGAYCMTRVPGVHPYVFMNYTGDRRSVLTLAHELGHGLHGYLAQDQGVFNAETPLTLAETASVFGEALTFKRLLAREDDPQRRLDLLVARLDDTIATTFRQIAMNRYEEAVHTARRGDGELSPDRLSELWVATQRDLLADSVDLEGYETWWSYVPHYVVSPGYVYAYAFGYLFSLAIFRRYEAEGEAVVEPYLNLLRAGGSDAPVRLAKLVGLDLADPALWSTGLDAVDEILREAEELAERTTVA
jgi:oligoendopeptidase F